MSNILALDCGTNQVHWVLAGPHRHVSQGAIPNQEVGTLALREWQNVPRPVRVIGVNVAGEATRVRVEAQLVRWRMMPEWLTASASAGGVVNGYSAPTQLGADRWMALIAAHRHMKGELFPAPCVVVTARTTVSIDALEADGTFRGGIVVPGINSMIQSVAASTPGMRMQPGRYHDFALSNADALPSGAVQAICGAIESMRRRVSADALPKCLLSGGTADELAPHLTGVVEVVDNLVLEGILALADA
jgi:type III pantothenate kinase